VDAPDSAVGKRGKCPFCQQTTYIPLPVSEDEVLDLAPVDEEEERRRQEEIEALRQQERDLIAEIGGEAAVPLEQRDDLAPEDLHHFVVNYCLDMAGGKLDRARVHATRLREFGSIGREAVRDFQNQKVAEPAVKDIPEPVLMGFLKQLVEEIG
jgi:hypothetical protein